MGLQNVIQTHPYPLCNSTHHESYPLPRGHAATALCTTHPNDTEPPPTQDITRDYSTPNQATMGLQSVIQTHPYPLCNSTHHESYPLPKSHAATAQ